jgi:hypothetical protein
VPNTIKYELPVGKLSGTQEVVFEVTRGRTFLGTLELSADKLVWIPAGSSQYIADWLTFDEIMRENLTPRHPGRRRRVGKR